TVFAAGRDWLAAHREQPFFAFVHLWDVHFDYAPPVPWEKRFDPNYVGDLDGRNFLRNPAIRRKMDPRDLEHLIALYDGEIGYTDVLVGRLLDQLDAQGIGSSPLVVLTSDHGDAFFEHGVKGHQQDLHVEALRIPLLFRGPGVPRGVRRPGPASIIDVAPTLLELTGLEAPGPPAVGRGVSLVEAMRDPTVLDDRWVFAELRCCGHWDTAVVGRDTKIVRDRLTDSLQVYDLKQDPGERRPRAPTVEESGRINGTLWGLKRHAPNFPAAEKIGPPAAELAEQLRALGYAE
ncbi:MAG: sulfatase-like hydrolase/transferase, partial [Myxococcales bacterium]|nr:sulfatase-like hydrolase/transferase [Myxococcales bacterium]